MDLTKTAREITRLMLPYLTTQQNRQLKKVLSHCLFDENQLAENSGDSDNKSFLDLFLSAKRLEGCSDRTVPTTKQPLINCLNRSTRQPATWEPKRLGPIFPTISKKPASVASPSTMSEESSQASTHGSKMKTISSRVRLDALKGSRPHNPLRKRIAMKSLRFFVITAGRPETLP